MTTAVNRIMCSGQITACVFRWIVCILDMVDLDLPVLLYMSSWCLLIIVQIDENIISEADRISFCNRFSSNALMV